MWRIPRGKGYNKASTPHKNRSTIPLPSAPLRGKKEKRESYISYTFRNYLKKRPSERKIEKYIGQGYILLLESICTLIATHLSFQL